MIKLYPEVYSVFKLKKTRNLSSIFQNNVVLLHHFCERTFGEVKH